MNTMKSTKKCVLVPFDKYQRVFTNVNAENAEEEITEQPSNHANHNKIEDIVTPKENQMEETLILDQLPKTLRSRAKLLLHSITQNHALTWDGKGELVVRGTNIPHSHITDLLKDALVQYKHFEPVGISELYANLNNVPLSLIRNPKRREVVQRGRGEIIQSPNQVETGQQSTPPPGIPNTRKERVLGETVNNPSTGTSDKWKSLWQILQ